MVEEHEAEIEERYPKLKRSISGYNLRKAIYENDDDEAVSGAAFGVLEYTDVCRLDEDIE